jgi:predicted short-subunit dehydrogenase-like oxidoreductase (DUF2520 family)
LRPERWVRDTVLIVRVALLGTGRFGRSVAPLLVRADVDAVLVGRGDPLPADVDVVWLAVRDGQIDEAAARLPDGAVALHASGAAAADRLCPRLRGGVLHPLMTFPGPEHGLPELAGVGARVGGHPDAERAARTLCARLGMVAFELHGAPARYHAAAALASGQLAAAFLVAADTLAAASGLSDAEARAVLLPLARASLDAVARGGVSAATGPVVRGDQATISAHRACLCGTERAVYDALVDALRERLALVTGRSVPDPSGPLSRP